MKALSNPRFKWRTIRGVAAETKLDPVKIIGIIDNLANTEVVRSSRLSKNGDELFTTREHLADKASPLEKVFGALKYRAD